MEKIIVKNRKEEAEARIILLGACINQLQAVSSEFCKLSGTDTPLTVSELQSLFTQKYGDPFARLRANVDVINNLIIQRHFPDGKVNGIPINPETIGQIVQLPPLDELTRLIEKTNPEIMTFMYSNFIAVEDKEIVISEGSEERIRTFFITYTETDVECERFEAAKGLADALNRVCQLLPENDFTYPLTTIGELETVVELDDSGVFVPHEFFVKTGRAIVVQPVVDYRPAGDSRNETGKTTGEPSANDQYIEDFINDIDQHEEAEPGASEEDDEGDFLESLTAPQK